jgi:hypothetical protein
LKSSASNTSEQRKIVRLQSSQEALGNIVGQLHAMTFDLQLLWHAFGIREEIMQREYQTRRRIRVNVDFTSDQAYVVARRSIAPANCFQPGDLLRGALGELRQADLGGIQSHS